MLDLAIKYQSEIRDRFIEVAENPKYKFYFSSYYNYYDFSVPTTEYASISRVSIDPTTKKVIGYFSAGIKFPELFVDNIALINFGESSFTFSRDLMDFIKYLFISKNFYKINFYVYIGNPSELIYDKFVSKFGGRIVGIRKKEAMLKDGKIYDIKYYELFREDFLNSLKGRK